MLDISLACGFYLIAQVGIVKPHCRSTLNERILVALCRLVGQCPFAIYRSCRAAFPQPKVAWPRKRLYANQPSTLN
jgi:hypothetical protein